MKALPRRARVENRVSPGDDQFSPERRLSPPDCQYTNNSRTTADRRTASPAGVARVPPTPGSIPNGTHGANSPASIFPIAVTRSTPNRSYSATARLDRQLTPDVVAGLSGG